MHYHCHEAIHYHCHEANALPQMHYHINTYDERKRNNTDQTSAEFFAAGRLVKRSVKQAKRNKEINVARLCKTNPKDCHSYINE